MAGGIPSLVPAVDESFWAVMWAVNFPFLVGASFFLLAATLAFVLVMHTRPIGHGVPPEHLGEYWFAPSSRWSVFTINPRRVDWWSNLLQLLGAAIFEFNSIAAVVPPWFESHPNLTIFMPSTIASVLFVVSSYMKLVEAVHAWWAVKPQSLGWWEGVCNVAGSLGFLTASVAGFWSTDRLTVEIVGVYLWYFVGSIFFWLGSYAKVVDTVN